MSGTEIVGGDPEALEGLSRGRRLFFAVDLHRREEERFDRLPGERASGDADLVPEEKN